MPLSRERIVKVRLFSGAIVYDRYDHLKPVLSIEISRVLITMFYISVQTMFLGILQINGWIESWI